MSADRLREAAKVLRERGDKVLALDANPGDAVANFVAFYGSQDESLGGHLVTDGAYIATVHPGVGLALADWLDTAGADLWAHGPMCACEDGCHLCDHVAWAPHARRALALADLILGGAS